MDLSEQLDKELSPNSDDSAGETGQAPDTFT